ncbi:MAG: adenosylcobinamide kinase [Clostridia bacterium]|nr:adenosylcobinamide kinase [Clostridia bacterium]
MILVIGGVGQGKLDYVLKATGSGPDDAAKTPEEAKGKPIFYGLETWLKDHPGEDFAELLSANPEVVILCDEVGCGVVPIHPEERAWRETVGRACCALAKRADRVERVFCGLPMVLKGEGTWN